MRGVLFVGGIVGRSGLAVAHVLDVTHDIGLHVARSLGAEFIHDHAHHSTHCIAQIGPSVLQVGDCLSKQRLGLGVGLLIKGQARAQLASPTEQLTQSINGSGQARAGILCSAGQRFTRTAFFFGCGNWARFQRAGIGLGCMGALGQARHIHPGVTLLFNLAHRDTPQAIRIRGDIGNHAVMAAVLPLDDVAGREISGPLGLLLCGFLGRCATRLGGLALFRLRILLGHNLVQHLIEHGIQVMALGWLGIHVVKPA